MPSDFVNGRPSRRRKTLPDLLRALETSPSTAPRALTTAPLAGRGRVRSAQRSVTNRESEHERRQKAAREALKRLKGS